ncbi:MAG TPA: nucleoside triphosphate pyrophosphohydrolase [Pelolinea sp.]|nr:nucleoside triphosphate pyrophosphohydrolase [Pelolinea sp.]
MNFTRLIKIIELIEFDNTIGLKLVNGFQLINRHSLIHQPDENALYIFKPEEIKATGILGFISSYYPKNYEITCIIEELDSKPQLSKKISPEIPMDSINQKGGYLFFPALRENSSINSFIELIAHLRSPEGCPWDRKQTHRTLRTNLLEETYEVLESLDQLNSDLLREELGDLLLQIVLHAQIAAEEHEFDLFDVIEGIHKKIVFRHPHVFGDWDVEGVAGVMRNWEILKSEERGLKDQPDKKNLLDSVPKNLPALSLAQKYQERAARVGFDWPEIAPVFDKIEEEIRELREADDGPSKERELGDLLFAIINLVRWYGLDAESVLRQMNQRFLTRFSFIENMVANQGRKMTDLSLVELDDIWDLAKKEEAKSAQNGR